MKKVKKIPAYIGLITVILLLAAPIGIAQAQSTTGVITGEPLPQPPPPPPPPVTTTQQTQQTSGGSTTTTRTTTATGTRTPSPLPQPELPVIDLSTQETKETLEECPTVSPEMCLDPRDAEATIIPPVIGNQLKISLLVFLGALLGAILWIISNYAMNSTQARRDAVRFARQDRLMAEEQRVETLRQSYNELIDSLANLFKQVGDKLLLDKQSLAAYKKASAGVELFGSEDSLAANRNLLDMVSGPKTPSAEAYESAKSRLIDAIKKDLGI